MAKDCRNNKMKITKTQLKQIIKEELERVLNEAFKDIPNIPTWEGYPIDLVDELYPSDWNDIIEQANKAGIQDHPLADKARSNLKALGELSADSADPCTFELLPGEDEWDRDSRLHQNGC
jgi:hypothetical protein